MTEIAIIGAGPYGLSLSAHLTALGLDHQIFGRPMETWKTQMPKDMLLKSEGFASSLFDPDSSLSLKSYCLTENVPYEDTGLPVRRETFVNYGMDFHRRLVPHLDSRLVTSLTQHVKGFQLGLEGGETIIARKVVLAIGICHYQYTPPV